MAEEFGCKKKVQGWRYFNSEVFNQNEWKVAKVIHVYSDKKGHVRSFQLYVGASDPDHLLSRVLVLIDQIVLLKKMNQVQP